MNLQDHLYSVSEITKEIKLLLEDSIPTIWVQGEVSNFKQHYSGHYYFTLKDSNAQLSAVMWSSRVRLMPFQLEDGMQVKAWGNIRVYEKSGRYQIDIIRMQPSGQGELQQAFEQLKRKLFEEGLFDEKYKKKIPAYPDTIGIITSESGAAIQDMIQVAQRRAPAVQLILLPVKVQGLGAGEKIASAVKVFNEYANVDLIILGRGGGSIEDLWPFNEEVLARAIFESQIPIVSAVGHEIDFTISDFVADLRAPTPSAAIEMTLPDQIEIKSYLMQYENRMQQIFFNRTQYLREKVESLKKSYGLRRPEDLVLQYIQQIDDLSGALNKNILRLHDNYREILNNLKHRLVNMSPQNVLKRGYSISYQKGQVITDIAAVNSKEQLETHLKNGKIHSKIISLNEG